MSTVIEFETGQIVRLKSGGPDMTVRSYRPSNGLYTCQWFAGKKLEQGEFKTESLISPAAPSSGS
ncbi:DUF2158 domain-containing protein [Pseudomonas syringae]|uniref:YodC family protein n=1 Tax=Pseudomonas syringae TaxID=317 RepID=UPI000BB61AE5|nr:DUF2158 domain-containing protein [Pseudomonas syringae]PBP36172.1 DUF2158 domain-containing protein [Pseudomonas syringae]PBP45321.1 DUF2158 domain-containing protein [Pseudomonas syringae]